MSDWIKCSDRLPEEGCRVLTLDISEVKFKEYRIDYIIAFENETPPYIWACRLQHEMYKVTHWMPLPSPPKE